MIYRVQHVTTYLYSQPVSMCHTEAHLTPRDRPEQSLVSSELAVDPPPDGITTYRDYFGNDVTFFTVQQPHEKLVVTAESLVEVRAMPQPAPQQSTAWERVGQLLRGHRTPETLDALQYVFESPFVKPSESLAAYARDSFSTGRPIVEAALDLAQRMHREFKYDQTATTIATPIEEVLAHREGVCQDFAHVMIGCLRSLGLPARYVSGYLRTRVKDADPALVGADASHAWVSVYCGGLGWLDFDPTNNALPSGHHVTLAWGRDYDDVSPVKGVILGGGDEQTIQVAVNVRPA
jgi:transglutaminase-like putative cysteine protease